MKMLLPAAAAVAAAAIALPASASAAPPVPAPPGSECTFDSGITTCVEMTESRQEETSRFEDPDCPSGMAESHRVTTTWSRTTTVFRGMDRLGEQQTEPVAVGVSVSFGCVPA